MAYSYTRQSTISDGDTITAALFNNEYNELLNSFAYSSSDATATGHRHDGSAAQGGSIYRVGDLDYLNKIEADSTNNRWGFYVQVSSSAVEQIRVQDGAIVPVTDNDIDLGTSSLEFKDAFFDGTVTSDAFAGPLTGDVTGNVSGTAATVTTAAQSNITSLGTLTTLTVDNVIINGTTIGHTSDTDLLTLTSGVLTVAGEVDASSLDISGNADIDGTLEADAITVDGTALNEYIADTVGAMVGSNTESGITVAYQDGDNTLDFTVGTLNQDTTGTAATVTGAAQSNITSLGTLTTLTVDNVIINGTTIGHTGDTDLITLASGIATVAGEISVTTLDIGGTNVTSTAAELNILDGKAFLDEDDLSSDSATGIASQQSIKAYVDASASSTESIQDIAGAMFTSNTETGITATYQDADGTIDLVVGTLNQDTTGTAAIATTVTITDNENTNENNAIIFTAGGDLDGGNLGLESDGDLHYNPSTGLLTATSFAGALTGNVTGNASGTAATVTTAAQSNITSLGTLTTLTVDNVIINGSTIGHTGDTDLMTVASGILTVAGEVSMTTLDIGGTNVTSTAAELNILDGVTSTATEINQLDALTRGSILYGNASAVTTRLAVGSANYVLTSDGTDISWAAAGGAYSSWLVKTADFTCADGDQLVCNHASTAFTITLPSGVTVGRTVTISNIGAATVTVGRNSQKINSTASDATLLTNRSTQLVFVDTDIGWKELP